MDPVFYMFDSEADSEATPDPREGGGVTGVNAPPTEYLGGSSL